MSRICLLALIGLPGAGKSTFSSWLLQQQIHLNGCNILHLCYDDYLDKFNTTSETVYKKQRQLIFKHLEKLIETMNSPNPNISEIPQSRVSLNPYSKDFLIICDDNHYYHSMRYKLYQLTRHHGCRFLQIHINTALTTALERNNNRLPSSRIPVDVVKEMYCRLEVPNTDNPWECNTFTLSGVESYEPSLPFLLSSFDLTISTKPITSINHQPQLQSLVHKLDLLLRSRIKSQLQALDSPELKPTLAQSLNQKRKQLLEQFRADLNADNNLGSVEMDKYFVLLK